jgi:ELWxxDGT repeat protein
VNGTLFFSVGTSDSGRELWKADGTTAGTILVKDINPGAGSSAPSNLTNVNGMLYFTAFDPVNGTELWKSDGTTAGTVLVRDINLGQPALRLLISSTSTAPSSLQRPIPPRELSFGGAMAASPALAWSATSILGWPALRLLFSPT